MFEQHFDAVNRLANRAKQSQFQALFGMDLAMSYLMLTRMYTSHAILRWMSAIKSYRVI